MVGDFPYANMDGHVSISVDQKTYLLPPLSGQLSPVSYTTWCAAPLFIALFTQSSQRTCRTSTDVLITTQSQKWIVSFLAQTRRTDSSFHDFD